MARVDSSTRKETILICIALMSLMALYNMYNVHYIDDDHDGPDDFSGDLPVEEEQVKHIARDRPKRTRSPNEAGYTVRPFHFKAEKEVEKDDITIVTQLDSARLQRLANAARSWNGPVSACIFVKLEEAATVEQTLKEFREKTPVARDLIDFHLLYQKEGRPYPVNTLRNVALGNVKTDTVFLSDVDLVSNQEMKAFKKTYQQFNDDGFGLLVVPAFESDLGVAEFPRTKAKLEETIKQATVLPVAISACFGCHSPTRLDHWFQTKQPYDIDFDWYFEPFFMGPADMELYDERFEGYGNDKMSHGLELVVAGYHFVAVPDQFVIHVNHPRAPWGDDFSSVIQELNRRSCHFFKDLEAKYAPAIAKAPPAEAARRTKALMSPHSHPCFYYECGHFRLRIQINHDSSPSKFTVIYVPNDISFEDVKRRMKSVSGEEDIQLSHRTVHGGQWQHTTQSNWPGAVEAALAAGSTLFILVGNDGIPPRHEQSLMFSGNQVSAAWVGDIPAYKLKQHTFEMWVFPVGGWSSTATKQGYIFSLDWKIVLFRTCFGGLTAMANINADARHMLVTGVPDHTWTHIALSVDIMNAEKSMEFHINGQWAAKRKIGTSDEGFEYSKITLGASPEGTDQAFDGLLDEVRIWSTLRTGAEIKRDMVKQPEHNQPHLIGYWDFNNPPSPVETDLTPNRVELMHGVEGIYVPEHVHSDLEIEDVFESNGEVPVPEPRSRASSSAVNSALAEQESILISTFDTDTEGWKLATDAKGLTSLYIEDGKLTATTNLLSNPGAEDGTLAHWAIIESGGSGWHVSSERDVVHSGERAFTTSFEWCRKAQTINMLSKGYPTSMLDSTSPTVYVEEWARSIGDGPDFYQLKVTLHPIDGSPMVSWEVNSNSEPISTPDGWLKYSRVFTDIGKGLRSIYFEDGGKDMENWFEWYGTALDDAYVGLASDVPIYFSAPKSWLGDQSGMYGQWLKIQMSIRSALKPVTGPDIILQGTKGKLLYFFKTQPVETVSYVIPLTSDAGWLWCEGAQARLCGTEAPKAAEAEFRDVLGGLQRLLIRAKFAEIMIASGLDEVMMFSCVNGLPDQHGTCTCHPGFKGRFCQQRDMEIHLCPSFSSIKDDSLTVHWPEHVVTIDTTIERPTSVELYTEINDGSMNYVNFLYDGDHNYKHVDSLRPGTKYTFSLVSTFDGTTHRCQMSIVTPVSPNHLLNPGFEVAGSAAVTPQFVQLGMGGDERAIYWDSFGFFGYYLSDPRAREQEMIPQISLINPRSGSNCLFITNDESSDILRFGGFQHAFINSTEPGHFILSAWSAGLDVKRNEALSAGGENYGLTLEMKFTDGTFSEMAVIPFSDGWNSWTHKCIVFSSPKPVEFASVFINFAMHNGTVAFDDVGLYSSISDFERDTEFSADSCERHQGVVKPKLKIIVEELKFQAQHEVDPADVSITSHCTRDRFPALAEMVAHWHGPISIVVYVLDMEKDIQAISDFRDRWPAAAEYVDFHLAIADNSLSADFSGKGIYPANILRNYAMKLARTDLVFIVDIDFVPNKHLYPYLQTVRSQLHRPKTAYVVASFELNAGESIPETKAELLPMYEMDIIRQVHRDRYAVAHKATNYDRWLHAEQMYTVNYEFEWEPYIIISTKDCPWFDERFIGYGFDKVEYFYEIDRAGYKYIVLPDGFIVHKDHGEPEWRGRGELIKRTIFRWMHTFMAEVYKTYQFFKPPTDDKWN